MTHFLIEFFLGIIETMLTWFNNPGNHMSSKSKKKVTKKG